MNIAWYHAILEINGFHRVDDPAAVSIIQASSFPPDRFSMENAVYLMRQASQRFGPLPDGIFKVEKRNAETVLFIIHAEGEDDEGMTAQSLLDSLGSRQMLG